MGIFRTTVSVAPLADPETRRDFDDVMVDTGSEYNWFPADALTQLGITPVRTDRFETAHGRVLEREVGFAMLYAGGRSTPTIVVFAQRTDLVLLGAFGLEGLISASISVERSSFLPALCLLPPPRYVRSDDAPAPRG
jgi:predicted aspartyl protease